MNRRQFLLGSTTTVVAVALPAVPVFMAMDFSTLPDRTEYWFIESNPTRYNTYSLWGYRTFLEKQKLEFQPVLFEDV